MKKKIALPFLALLAAVLAFFAVRALTEPSLSSFLKDFDIQTENVKITVLRKGHQTNFRDSIRVWVVSADGEISGSLFDPSRMEEGTCEEARLAYEMMQAELAAEKDGPLYELTAGGEYLSAAWQESPENAADGDALLCVIYDAAQELYYISWIG